MQERCWEEVNRVIGADRSPRLSDRSNTPYVDATIQVHKTMLLTINASRRGIYLQELMRHSPHLALTQSHWLSKDMEFRGYHFPKETRARSK